MVWFFRPFVGLRSNNLAHGFGADARLLLDPSPPRHDPNRSRAAQHRVRGHVLGARLEALTPNTGSCVSVSLAPESRRVPCENPLVTVPILGQTQATEPIRSHDSSATQDFRTPGLLLRFLERSPQVFRLISKQRAHERIAREQLSTSVREIEVEYPCSARGHHDCSMQKRFK